MKLKNERRSFREAMALAQHALKANRYLKQVCAACEAGDKIAAQRALRQAIIELETARAGLQVGME
jgi:hypothetical protein